MYTFISNLPLLLIIYVPGATWPTYSNNHNKFDPVEADKLRGFSLPLRIEFVQLHDILLNFTEYPYPSLISAALRSGYLTTKMMILATTVIHAITMPATSCAPIPCAMVAFTRAYT